MIRSVAADPLAVYPVFRAGRDSVAVAAPAKLNLFLEILAKRPDGYHALESLMLTVDLFDTLEVRSAVPGSVTLTCNVPGLPTGPENLVVKAANALLAHAKRTDLGTTIQLTKRIPTQAGLAGGSSDAALALLALNEIWKLGLTRPELGAIGAAIGSDVAFFMTPPAGWCTGRGEIVEPEPVGRPLDFVLVCPPVGLATADVYRRLEVPGAPRSGDDLRAAVRAGDAEAIGRTVFNRLEEPAFALSAEVRAVRDRLAALAPLGARMSGSGSAVFAVCRSREEANQVATAFRRGDPDTGRATCATQAQQEARVLVVRSLAP